MSQGTELDGLEEKAIKTGASSSTLRTSTRNLLRVHSPQLRQAQFTRVSTSSVHHLPSYYCKKLVEIAKKRALTLSATAAGKGNDQVRFELAIKAYAQI